MPAHSLERVRAARGLEPAMWSRQRADV